MEKENKTDITALAQKVPLGTPIKIVIKILRLLLKVKKQP